MSSSLVIVAGCTGNLGESIAKNLLGRHAKVRALIRRGSNRAKDNKRYPENRWTRVRDFLPERYPSIQR